MKSNFNKTNRLTQRIEQTIKKNLLKSALLVEASANRLAPVDTGRLRASITHRVFDYSALVGTNVEYAPYVELGTSKMAAQPYLEPALYSNVARINTLFKSEILKTIREVL